MTDAEPSTTDEITLSIIHHGKPLQYNFPATSTITDLTTKIEEELSIPESHQKFLIQKLGLQKPPFKDPNLPLSSLANKKITLLAPSPEELANLTSHIASATRQRKSVIPSAQPSRTRDWKRVKEEAEYTFHTLRPLNYLPRPERSLRFLERLRDDPGIRASMRMHEFSVPLLTEMDPAAYTEASHEGVSRILGLNRNQGEVIELRLRTDAGDGYRDYKTIRKTLCHELAHNVHGPHDSKFWKLCREIEKEVDKHDWKSGGHSVSSDEFYEPAGEIDEHIDGGGWTGGEFVLGGNSPGGSGSSSVGGERSDVTTGQMSRRDILARAAEERLRKARQAQENAQEKDMSDQQSAP